MDNAKQSPYLDTGYLTTLYDQSPQNCIPGHDPVRLQCMFAPINLYVIADSVTSSCIPICLYLSVLLARYLQHGLCLLSPCFYRDGSCEDEVPE
jgi:hypothetical protein